MNGSANIQIANTYGNAQGPPAPKTSNPEFNPAFSSGPPLMSDEKIFEWEFKETQGQIDPNDEGYTPYMLYTLGHPAHQIKFGKLQNISFHNIASKFTMYNST